MAKKVICTCASYGCGRKQVRNEFGQMQPGHLLSTTAKRNHERKDEELGLDRRNPSMLANATPNGTRKTAPESIPSASRLPAKQREERGTDVRSVSGMEPTIAGYKRAIYTLLCTLAAWLHLTAGLSRDATDMVLKICKILIVMALHLGSLITRFTMQATIHDQSRITAAIQSLRSSIPTSVRSAVAALAIEPTIQRSVCCPRCFARYKLDNLPQKCYFRETSRSRLCNEPLWTTRNTRKGPIRVPRRLYTTQDPDSWFEYFLSRPGIEDEIANSYKQKPTSGRMHSIQDSPAWHSLGNFTTTEGNLTFSFFIDWFNPMTNKIAGKSASCGAIMMFCLNLPEELQHLPENTFFVGITPPPKEPTVTSITNLLDPVMERFDFLFRVGKAFRTFKHPEGRHTRVAILPAIGDLLAMRKAVGFAGVGSKKHFCSVCTLHKDDIEELDTSKFTPRDGIDTKIAGQKWHDAETKKERTSIFDKFGIRWTSLHLLSYRDLVKHTVLGVMHNWLEGVLQHHARVFWGITVSEDSSTKSKKSATKGEDSSSDAASDTTATPDNIDEELEALHQEVQPARTSTSDLEDIVMSDAEESAGGTDSEGERDASALSGDEDEDFDDDEDTVEDGSDMGPSPHVFTDPEMQTLRQGLSDIITPSYLARLPTNFGQASHGKLKADQWLVAFTVFFPLILPELWLSDGSKRKSDLLDNFYHLVTCTNIVCGYSVSNEDADRYTSHYIEYRRTARNLFSRSSSRPNHHYAMHNGPMMKFWGPLIKVSEFPYESNNGVLQRIKTNHHLWELDLTMLRNICRRGRLQAMFRESPLSDINSLFSSAMSLFQNASGTSAYKANTESQEIPSEGDNSFNGSGVALPESTYDSLLAYLHQQEPAAHFRHRSLVPHPEDANTLTHYARVKHHILWKTCTYSPYSTHSGNSSISYLSDDGNSMGAGFIECIFEQAIQGHIRTFIVIAPHAQLSPEHQLLNPYASRPNLLAAMVYDCPLPEQDKVIIEPERIVGHVPFRRRPSGTFGIDRPTLILVNSLHRDRYLQ